ncbi:MAG: type IV toxin-antitoxin system AbiEi family antitoxin domain-containing protein [Geoalkalibacter sp.]|uniref:type IV toxin-antitoxin system AbiEi family antitoxin domain-containing protein n=1 Tax=Geoalkalibacter sp. TaxID=3041440 RepID=UPI003D119BF5
MGLHSSEILKKVLFSLPPGMPISTWHLKKFGISRQLAYRYVQHGWLKQLGYGYYLRPGDKLTETGSVASLQANDVAVHIGGKSALTLKGFTHYLSMSESTLTLYGRGVRNLPKWFQQQFKVVLSNSLLFDEPEKPAEQYCVSRLAQTADAPLVSEPERAVLEMLDLVPKQQTFEEARQIMEGLQSLRTKKMQELLTHCKKIKAKRLFWQVAEELHLTVLAKVDAAQIDFGSKSAYILQGEKTLVLRNPNG